MNKIKWNTDEEKNFLNDAKEYIICKECGYLVKNPEDSMLKCTNCGSSYEKTKSFVASKYKNDNKII